MNTQETNKTMVETTNFRNESKFKANWEEELHQENVAVYKKIFGEIDIENKRDYLN
jgi:hypothetical protein